MLIFLVLNGGCGSQKKVVHEVQENWTVSYVINLIKDDKSGDYLVGIVSLSQYLVLEYNTENIVNILSVLEYSLKYKKDIKLKTEDSVYGILVVDAKKIKDDN